jgi:hypothetical protein
MVERALIDVKCRLCRGRALPFDDRTHAVDFGLKRDDRLCSTSGAERRDLVLRLQMPR